MSTTTTPKTDICKGFKKDHSPCRRKVCATGEEFCWQHSNQYIVTSKKKVYKTPVQIKIDNILDKLESTRESIKYIEKKIMEVHDIELEMEFISLKSQEEEYSKLLSEYKKESSNMTTTERKFRRPVLEKVTKGEKKVPLPRDIDSKESMRISEMELRRYKTKTKNFEYKKYLRTLKS